MVVAGQAARLLAACALAYVGAAALGLTEGYWALITAVVVLQPGFGETLAAGRSRILGTLIGAAAGLAVMEAARYFSSPAVLFWVALVPLAVLTAIRPSLRLCCITLIVVVLVPAHGDVVARPVGRVIEILLGTLAALIVSSLATPTQPMRD